MDTDDPMTLTPTRSFPPRPRVVAGMLVEHEGRRYRILVVNDLNEVTALDPETRRTKTLPIAELDVVAPSEDARRLALDGLTEEQDRIAKKRLAAIEPLLEQPTSKDVAARAMEEGCSPRTLYRWIRLYTSTYDYTTLVPRKRGWTEGNTRIAAAAEHAITDVIRDFYLKPLRPGPKKVIEEVQRVCFRHNIEPPSPSTIRQRLQRVPEDTRLEKRGEPDRARTRYEPAAGSFPGADYPLAVVQIDHTQADVIVVDDVHREPIGRPWLTFAIDLYSRVITGYYLSLDPPSILSVAMCVTHSILPKDRWLIRKNVTDAEWPVWGFPDVFHVDNGSDFRSADIQSASAKHGVNIEYRPLARTSFGGHVERLIGNVMENFRGLPGYTASSVAKRGEQDPESHAAMTMGELERWLLIWICKQYHRQTHRAILTSPMVRWEQGIIGDPSAPGPGMQVRHPTPEDLRRDFLPSVERTVQKTGVTVDKLRYYAEPLRPWIGKRDAATGRAVKLKFRRDPRNIDKLWFYDPKANHYYKIPLVSLRVSRMSLWEYEHARKRLKMQGRKNASPIDIVRAVDERRQIEEGAQSDTLEARKKARRNRQRHNDHAAAHGEPPPSPSASGEPGEPTASDLSYQWVGHYEIIE